MITNDEFNWATFTKDHYEKQIKDSPFLTLIKNFSIIDGELNFHGNICPNHAEIYHQIFQLDVCSVYECGFGAGQHLINIYEILKEKGVESLLDIGGCEISEEQLDMGIRMFQIDTYPFLSNLQIADFSSPLPQDDFKQYDFVFTHAVTMHLGRERCIQFLHNMKLIANKYILLIENFAQHDYDKMLKEIFPEFTKTQTSKYVGYGVLLTRK